LGCRTDRHGRRRRSGLSHVDRAGGESFDLVDELLGVERLLDEVVGARALPLVGVVRLLLRRKKKDRDRRILCFDLRANGIAACPLQRDVTENDARTFGSQLGERSVGAVGADDAKILAGEGHLQDFAHRDAVVDGEQGRGHGKFSSLRSRWPAWLAGFASPARTAG
jgi:hypothetical protein